MVKTFSIQFRHIFFVDEKICPVEKDAKGQLISKCPFGFIVSTKLPTEKFDKLCPRMGRAEFVKFFGGILVQTMKAKRHFEIN